jgi:integrase
MVKERFRLAGVVGDRKTTHSLRHGAITNAIRQALKTGRSPLAVKGFARHQSMDTTLGYYHEVGRLDDPLEDIIDYSNGK